MITRIREVRLAKGLTLQQVADRCRPPTTAQTVGRLETGTRTVSVGWLNRIAQALGADAGDLVQLSEQAELPVAAVLNARGASAPRRLAAVLPPRPEPDEVAIPVEAGIGDYRAGDVLWCRRIGPDRYPEALGRDVLVPRPAGRFCFGRMISADDTHFVVLEAATNPPQREEIELPPWIALTTRLVRPLG